MEAKVQSNACVNPDVGRLVFRWSMLHGANEHQPKDGILIEHLQRCSACKQALRDWETNAEADQPHVGSGESGCR